MEQFKKETLYKTHNYDLFSLIQWNRSVKPNRPQARRLYWSMQQYGFLPSHPIMVRKGDDGSLIVFDGQHRLHFARKLGLPVYFVIDESGISIPDHQETNRKWDIGEHFERWQTAGKEDYKEAINFAQKYKITIGQAASLLAGTMTVSNVMKAVKEGSYEVKSRNIAYSVADCFRLIKLSCNDITNNSGVLNAVFACHFVDYFDVDQFKEQVKKNASMIINCDGRDGFLDAFQDVYNHRKRAKVPLAFDAKRVMEQRNAVPKKR